MSFPWFTARNKNSQMSDDKAVAIKRSADTALTTYAKTFGDLAKYDCCEFVK